MDIASDANGDTFPMREKPWKDVFSILTSSEDQPETLFRDIEFDLPLIHLENPYTQTRQEIYDLELPLVYDINDVAFPILETITDPSINHSFSSSESWSKDGDVVADHETKEEAVEDIWKFADSLGSSANDVKYITWEAFSDPTCNEETPLYLSEAGPTTFDAALQIQAEQSRGLIKAGRALQNNAFLRSLWQLSCGRASVLFPFDAEKRVFYHALEDGKPSGYTLTLSQSVVLEVMQVGNATVHLREFAELTYTSRSSVSGFVSLANATSTILDANEHYLVSRKEEIQSLLQLQAVLERPKELIVALKDVVFAAKSAKTNEELLSIMFLKAQQYDTSPVLASLMTSLVSKVSQHWLAMVEQRIGLRQSFEFDDVVEIGRHVDFEGDSLTTERESADTEENASLLSKADQRLVDASRQCLNFMKEHHPDHPLGKIITQTTSAAPIMELAFDWNDVERIEEKAGLHYEELQLAVSLYDRGDVVAPTETGRAVFGEEILDASIWPACDHIDNVYAAIASLENLSSMSTAQLSDKLYAFVTKLLESDVYHGQHTACAFPFSLVTHLSLQPYLSIQHRLLTTACLRSIVLEHSLRNHLDLCHAFHLCSSGFFTSRLSSVLFDPSFESVERQRSTLRSGSDSMGLKLGSGQRREWPPASSELRLALRGVLTESWLVSCSHNTDRYDRHRPNTPQPRPSPFEASRTGDASLPGGLSFALRTDLKPDEIDRVLNPDSVYALDFLALSYTPGKALEVVFTTACLEMYSRIFRLMLRMLRMDFIIAQIYRDTKTRISGTKTQQNLVYRFRYDCTYFITTLTSHFVYTCIGKPWTRFQKYLDDLESFTRDGGRTAENKNADFTLVGLTAMHETTLRTITTSLFLRNRQKKALVALETLFDTILQFARTVRDWAGDEDGVEETERLQKLHVQFNEQRADFVTACTALSEKAEFGGRKGGDGGMEEGALGVRDLVELLS